ncbi:uncharacterized protein LOC119941270 [Tachyglossus aculeatus]|uniref:uncharacterized protein LOC119941270 n=1 Tax=Tachyglossus aculeatus TaxID=9261 RepID=UPI0018F4ADD1|nr:uncharacterized protein LOC119941270 [Tachyglossus aculeatus]
MAEKLNQKFRERALSRQLILQKYASSLLDLLQHTGFPKVMHFLFSSFKLDKDIPHDQIHFQMQLILLPSSLIRRISARVLSAVEDREIHQKLPRFPAQTISQYLLREEHRIEYMGAYNRDSPLPLSLSNSGGNLQTPGIGERPASGGPAVDKEELSAGRWAWSGSSLRPTLPWSEGEDGMTISQVALSPRCCCSRSPAGRPSCGCTAAPEATPSWAISPTGSGGTV